MMPPMTVVSVLVDHVLFNPLLERSFYSGNNYTNKTVKNKNGVSVSMGFYPFQTKLDIWVEAHNILGTAESEHLQQYSDWFGKLMLSVYNVDLCGCGGDDDDDENLLFSQSQISNYNHCQKLAA